MAIDYKIMESLEHLNHKTQQFRICNYLTYYIAIKQQLAIV